MYKLCAISNAAGILSNYRRLAKKHHVNEPYCRRLKLTTCYDLKTVDGTIRIPGGFKIPLNSYTQRFLSQPDLEARSVTLTPDSLSISVRKQVQFLACIEMLGIDSNLDNVTLADTEEQTERYDLSKVRLLKSRYRKVRSHLSRNDVGVERRLSSKYGRLERNRVSWLLHNVSANVVLQAKLKRQAIVMEDLRGIRKLYRKGNGQGRSYRSRMNSWSYGELQRQIQY